MDKLILTPLCVDSWDRLVFKGSNDKFYKTIELVPHKDIWKYSEDDWNKLLNSVTDTTSSDGEPGWPVAREEFELRMPTIHIAYSTIDSFGHVVFTDDKKRVFKTENLFAPLENGPEEWNCDQWEEFLNDLYFAHGVDADPVAHIPRNRFDFDMPAM